MNDPVNPSQDVPCLIPAGELDRRVGELARQVSADYQGKTPFLIGVLKGSFVFLADLMRRLTVPVACDFVKLSSYGLGTASTGQVTLQLDLTIPAQGKDLLIVEDIIDTGTSTSWLLGHLRHQEPRSLRVCALLDKPVRRLTPVAIDYVGFTIPDHFVVGYGIDYAEQYRQLPYVGYFPAGVNDHGRRPV